METSFWEIISLCENHLTCCVLKFTYRLKWNDILVTLCIMHNIYFRGAKTYLRPQINAWGGGRAPPCPLGSTALEVCTCDNFMLLLKLVGSNHAHFFRQKTRARKISYWLQLYLDWLNSFNADRADVFGCDISYRSYKSHKINAQSILFVHKMPRKTTPSNT